MKTQDFTNTLTVDQTPEQVFDAINNPRAWWSENISGPTNRQGEKFHYAYRNSHTCDIVVEDLIPFTKVVWHVVDNHFEFVKDKSEWKDTCIVFDITQRGEKTVVTFTHVGLVPDYECYEICEKAWTFFTGDSLYKLITTGKGDPIEMCDASADAMPAVPVADQSLTFSFRVPATQAEVYNAVNDVRAWWSEEVEGESAKVGDEFEFRYKDIHYSKHRVAEQIPGRRVVWETLDSCLYKMENKTEWTGTRLVFEIKKVGVETELRFTHVGLTPEVECYESCGQGWEFFITDSLKQLALTGKGDPVLVAV